MPLAEERIMQAIYEAAGGRNSSLQQPTRARLGHPVTGLVAVPIAEADYPGQVWLHGAGESSPLQDNSSDQRENAPAEVFTALLKKNTLPENLIKFGTWVRLISVGDILEVDDLDGVAAEEYLFGVPPTAPVVSRPENFDYGLLRPTDPPSMRVQISGATYNLGGTLYDVQTVISDDLTAYLSSLSAGQAVAVQVTLDPTISALIVTAGSAFTDERDRDTGQHNHAALFENYPDTVPFDEFNKGWVVLYQGMQTVQAQDIYARAELYSKDQSQALTMADIASRIVTSDGEVVVSDGDIVFTEP